MTGESDLYARYIAEAQALAAGPALEITITPNHRLGSGGTLQALSVIAQLQLASRHPENTGNTAGIARDFADWLILLLDPSPTVAEVLQRGWNPDFTVRADSAGDEPVQPEAEPAPRLTPRQQKRQERRERDRT
jgi:hypothetical protein